ncbi:MAG: phospho-N-acetylmuramoyl-pentapeptide-transferase [Pedosphaera sp.]|nr:phospho-N-acetylmuramoyl-pentapeptide-transferase [Pedosphaera sp.]
MLPYLSQMLLDASHGTDWESSVSWLRVFKYITLRSAGAAITALFISLWLGRPLIRWLQRLKFGQHYDDKAEAGGDLKARVLSKKGTPGMGGLLIVLAMDVSALLWTQWNELIALTLLSVLVFAALGFYDDWMKVTKQTSAGATEVVKLVTQFALGIFIGVYLWRHAQLHTLVADIMVPFAKHPLLVGVPLLGVALTVLTIVGSSNAVNLTDGLDGLAIGCTLIVSFVFLIFTYLAGNVTFAKYLAIPYVPGAGELTVFVAAMIGAGLGFLWFNCHPAQVFMGDTGSLALGGALGIIAVLIHQPFVLVLAGGVFVAEAASVILQRGWFKYTRRKYGTGRRLFLMAPLHHHFEKLGWYESQVTTRFYILCFLCALVALSTLKLR